jgi:hypothetical protein
MLLMLPIAGQAQYTYTLSNGQITITKYTGGGGVVIIPSAIDGLPVRIIGSAAFFGRSDIKSVAIPNSVYLIGSDSFSNCSGITNITLGSGVLYINSYAFATCRSLQNVTIPNGLINIDDNAFNSCSSLTNVTMGTGVKSIKSGAFYQCISLTQIVIPGSVTNIGVSAFFGCTNLNSITVDALNFFYNSNDGVLFNINQTTLIQFPGGRSGSYSIPDSVNTIATNAFSYCTRLTNVTIGNGVTNIARAAFSECSALASITLPDSVVRVGIDAFARCSSLNNIIIGKGVAGIDSSAFFPCTNLNTITVDMLNLFYSSVDGVLFDKNQTQLIQYPATRPGLYIVPNSVTNILRTAFYSCCNLTDVVVPAGVRKVGAPPFLNCPSLTAVTVDSLNPYYSSVDGVLFNKEQTVMLQYPGGRGGNYTILGSVTNIGVSAFAYNSKLMSVTIPKITSIADFAFGSCANLTAIYFLGNAPSIGATIFFSDSKAVVYYLPGTTGWNSTFATRPTILWNPQIQANDASFGIQTNGFGFNITGITNLMIVVEASTNLGNLWIPIETNSLANGSFYFRDTQWTNDISRFYRLRSP